MSAPLMAPAAPSASEYEVNSIASATLPTVEDKQRQIVYHADIMLKVDDFPQTSTRLETLLRQQQGVIEDSKETREDGQWQQSVRIRITPARFQELLAGLRGLGTVEERRVSSDDVTAQHADVAARLAAKRKLEQRYLALLTQARKVSEMLEIEEKMGAVREDIEATESQLKTLDNKIAYATIYLRYYQPLPLATPDQPVLSFGSRIVDAFYSGWVLLTDVALGVVSIWPFLLVALGLFFFIRSWRRRRHYTQQP
ncbi:DUF4349 domain-containing protein [Hymenobacter aerilatus]|uniref:DUF4349 domain-containing protein n=1 Tax=Hymenobacter aerilatus TaxID=2932251 RepID=A0A8T9SZ34_9BACT|nr:DUF4349 domain-containing protein [Hymenobacter aerilatus]UOR07348.1 DUF4349 domain-containing protein [Hymenobacter aerilatus]